MIGYVDSVRRAIGSKTSEFLRLYTVPGVDHVATGAPANVDMLAVLRDWVELDRPPSNLAVVEQEVTPPFRPLRARPLCEWPRYEGGDDLNAAANFSCTSS